jgi:hypothetical protein
MTFPDKNALRTQVAFPNLLSGALLVYRITPRRLGEDADCLGTHESFEFLSVIIALNA